MSLNPLNELKRRLQDGSTPLPKRFRLAKNVIHSTHFPAGPKERIIAEWLENLTEQNGLSSKDIKDIIGWLLYAEDLTNDLKYRLIKVISQYLHSNPPKINDIHFIVKFLLNDKISTSLNNQVDDYLFITMTILQNLRYIEMGKNNFSQKLLLNLIKYYKECKRKLDFIIKLLHGDNLEILFSFLDSPHRDMVLNVCQNILFPITKKPLFASFLQNLLWKDNIDELITEKGDNIQSVIKILSAFFIFPNGRTVKDPKFLTDFIDVFISCYQNDSQVIFAFYIMAFNCLNMDQNCFTPAMKMPAIIFEENDGKIKRNIFLKMLNFLVINEIDTSVKLNLTLGEKISKVEIKKNFTSFLQATMLGLIKLEGKPDKITLQIIKTAIKLDPLIIEQKLDVILPPIMTAKKTSNALKAYIEMMNCLIETLFKLSRGTLFINQILNQIKLKLEAINIEQFELIQKSKENVVDELENIQSKIITSYDILPQECIEVYGKLTSELMSRQTVGLLTSLQKDLEENCLMMLDEGFVSPSIITITEMLTAILSSFFRNSKMADHTVPQPIAEEFWTSFEIFQNECLKKFGECILKLNYNPLLLLSFLKLCLSYSQLKLINLKYGNTNTKQLEVETNDIFDCSIILPCLSGDQWTTLAQMIQDDEAVITWDNLLLIKTMAIEISNVNNWDISQNEIITSTKTYLIKRLTGNPDGITSVSYFTKQLFSNIDEGQAKNLAKILVKVYTNGVNSDIFQDDAINKNRTLLNALVLEINKNIIKRFENNNKLDKSISKTNFDIVTFLESVNVKEYFTNLSIDLENHEDVLIYIELLKKIPIHYLEETYQLITIFVLLAVKNCCQTKKLRRNIDYLLQSTFELSPKCPDLFKIFPVDYMFSIENEVILNLLSLSIKTKNDQLIVKSILEAAVKKVKTNSEIVKELVEILLSKKRPSKKKALKKLEYFNDGVFQLQCLILPIITREKRAITANESRSILGNLQERLYQALLESFMHIDFTEIGSSGNDDGGVDESSITSEINVAALNAIGGYSLTLMKYCEITDVEEIKKMGCLLSGLEFFIRNAIKAIENPKSKYQHVDSSIQLLNIILRYKKKIECREIFQNKDAIFKQMWQSVKARLLMIFDENSKRPLDNALLENISVSLKFLAELSLLESFISEFLRDISSLVVLKKPSEILKNHETISSDLRHHRTSKYLLQHCLKANIAGPKCIAIKKTMFRICGNTKCWIQEHFEGNNDDVNSKKKQRKQFIEQKESISDVQLTSFKIDDTICKLLRIHLDMLAEVIMAAKKIPLDYRFIDAVFELQHVVHYILGHNLTDSKCEISWQSFFSLHEGCMLVLNKLLQAREELLEDRWPCYMQCYKTLILCVCDKVNTTQEMDKVTERKLAETAHSIEILTQSICKRKAHVSRIAAYAVADICTWIEKTAPPKDIRQHLENSIALLIQASDSSYAMAFLRRAMAGSVGQMTMSNMYSVYKRYHKYVGNA